MISRHRHIWVVLSLLFASGVTTVAYAEGHQASQESPASRAALEDLFGDDLFAPDSALSSEAIGSSRAEKARRPLLFEGDGGLIKPEPVLMHQDERILAPESVEEDHDIFEPQPDMEHSPVIAQNHESLDAEDDFELLDNSGKTIQKVAIKR